MHFGLQTANFSTGGSPECNPDTYVQTSQFCRSPDCNLDSSEAIQYLEGQQMFSKSQPNPNRPAHIYADDTFYFVTATTLNRAHLLTPPSHKPYLRERLLTLAPDYGLELDAWVILNNHYHILFHLSEGHNLSRFFKHLHGQTSTDYNKWDNQSGRQFWYSYWDRCIRNDRDYWLRFNYIHYNPIKHGYVKQLRDWPFSSMFDYLEIEGQD